MNEGLKVLKRDNKKVDFNGEKIAIAIKKAFDSREEFIEKYTDDDINKVYNSVLEDIYDNYFEKAYIKVEEIQDIIEKMLIKLSYQDVYESFSNYRDKRSESRKMFLSEPKQHKLLKAIEKITLKQDIILKNNETPMDVLLNYGKIISEEISNAYLINNKYIGYHESGQIYISDVEYYPVGALDSLVIDLNKMVDKNNKCNYDMLSCFEYIKLFLINCSKEQYGNQGLMNIDEILKESLLNTFKEEFKTKIYEYLDFNGYIDIVDIDSINRDIIKLNTMLIDIDNYYKYSKKIKQIEFIFEKAYESSILSAEKILYKSLYSFLHTYINNNKLTISIGLDTSYEGRMITKNYLLCLDDNVEINTLFSLSKGINYDKKDINYDLFVLASSTLEKGYKINFNILDYYEKDLNIFYFGDGSCLMDSKPLSGRGFLSKTYLNLARIGIKNNKLGETKEMFFVELEHILDIVKDQLIERFNFQSEKKASDFQFIIGENIYADSKGIKHNEKIKKSIKNGFLGIGIIGLSECIKSLDYKISDEEIIEYIKNLINIYKKDHNLNFVLIGPNIDISKEFIDIDRAIYGDIKDVTSKDCYDYEFNQKNNNYYQTTFDGGYSIIKDIDYKDEESVIEFIKENKIGFISIKKRS